MKPPADPKWRDRRWQTYHQDRGEYIKMLYAKIRFTKRLILMYERTGLRVPGVSASCAELIDFEKNQLQTALNELREVLGR